MMEVFLIPIIIIIFFFFFHIYYFVDNTTLGTACGKLFRVGSLSVLDAGTSDILTADLA
jgi:hypothetical protein